MSETVVHSRTFESLSPALRNNYRTLTDIVTICIHYKVYKFQN